MSQGRRGGGTRAAVNRAADGDDGRRRRDRTQTAGPKVTLLLVDDCAHGETAYRNVRAALDAVGLTAARVRVVWVRSLEHARRIGFTGSPTVWVDGVDPFADDAPSVGLSCRLFHTPDGVAGAPSIEQLISVLAQSCDSQPLPSR